MNGRRVLTTMLGAMALLGALSPPREEEREPAPPPPPPSGMRPADAFHAHLDVCRQCRDNPFGLCAVGGPLLERAAGVGPGAPPSPFADVTPGIGRFALAGDEPAPPVRRTDAETRNQRLDAAERKREAKRARWRRFDEIRRLPTDACRECGGFGGFLYGDGGGGIGGARTEFGWTDGCDACGCTGQRPRRGAS